MKKSLFLILALAMSLASCGRNERGGDQQQVVRIGHFPNVTHVQALVARHFSRLKEKGEHPGWFEERLGPGVKVEWFVYNAGPSAMEAIFARSIDVTYVGPSPAINAFSRSNGDEIRIVSGAVDGGAALVVHGDSPLKTAADFRGKKIATPQLGNTQDVAARAWLKAGGLNITQLGGDAQVLPTANPDQFQLFESRRVDGVWTVEPWVARLELSAGGKVLVDEKDAVTTILVSRVGFAKEHPAMVEKIATAHRELTDWIKANPEEARKILVSELSAITRSNIDPKLIAAAWPRIILTNEVNLESLRTYVTNAREAGFLDQVPPLENILLVSPSPAP